MRSRHTAASRKVVAWPRTAYIRVPDGRNAAPEIGRDLRAWIPPGLIKEDAVAPYCGQPEGGRVAADRVHPGARRKKRRARVDPVRASLEILAERAFHDGKLGAQIVASELAARLLRPADVVDTVERDIVEQRR